MINKILMSPLKMRNTDLLMFFFRKALSSPRGGIQEKKTVNCLLRCETIISALFYIPCIILILFYIIHERRLTVGRFLMGKIHVEGMLVHKAIMLILTLFASLFADGIK